MFSWLLIIVFGFILLAYSFLGPIIRTEIESNEFPILALQYRGSIFLSEADLGHMAEDMPGLYDAAKDILGEDFFWRMPRISEGEWYYMYFPLYSILSLPLKLLFQLLNVDQERCFTVTNALAVLFALIFVQQKLKVSSKQRLLAVALLASPLFIRSITYIT